jgi:hypothetical protein
MKCFKIFLILLVGLVSLKANDSRYYLEFSNMRIESDAVLFDIKLHPLNKEIILLSGNLRYNLATNNFGTDVKPELINLNNNLNQDVISLNQFNGSEYINIAFSSKELQGVKVPDAGLWLCTVKQKIGKISQKDGSSLVLPRIHNLEGYKNVEPKVNPFNCTLIFTTDSPYEPVQEGLPVNKVHFYTEQIVGSDSSFEIYPNPSTGFLTYNWSGADSNKDVFVKIFDNTGKLLMSRSMNQQTEGSLDISGYTPGLYFLHFENGGITEKHKIIKVD